MMKQQNRIRLSHMCFLAVVFLVMGLGACSKKKDLLPEEGQGYEEITDADISSGKADSDSENALGLRTIFFPFDSFEITGAAKDDLEHNSELLKANPDLRVQIEGHCDERGGIQYNLALGEKRANAIKLALQRMGIAKAKITTISMGKEKPLDSASNEEAWARNRRGNFVITQK